MSKIIINADDFGINDIVTSEIERMIKLKAITSTTIMANGKALDRVKAIISNHPEVSFGVHLCLDEFDSLTKSSTLHKYGLVKENGEFVRGSIFKIKKFPEELKKAIKQELSAQVKVLLNMGITPSHADSHHHVHTIYGLEDVFSEVLNIYNIKKIRRGVDLPLSFFKDRIQANIGNQKEKESIVVKTKGKRKNALSRAYSLIQTSYFRSKVNKYYCNKFITTDLFDSYLSHMDKIESHSTEIMDSCIELMCHPGHPNEFYKRESKLIEANALNKLFDFELISYNEL